MLSQEPATAQRQRAYTYNCDFCYGASEDGADRLQHVADEFLPAISISNYIDPGAGLKHLKDYVPDSDFIFDSLFMSSSGPVGDNGFASDVSGTGTPSHAPVPMVRTYKSDAAMYCYLPPPQLIEMRSLYVVY